MVLSTMIKKQLLLKIDTLGKQKILVRNRVRVLESETYIPTSAACMKFLSIVIRSMRIGFQPFIPKIKLSILHSDCHIFFEISVTCSAFDSIFIVIEVIVNIRGEVLVFQVIQIYKTMNLMLSNDFTTHTCYIYSERTPKEPCLVQRCLLNMGSFHSKHGEKRLCLGFLFGSAYI